MLIERARDVVRAGADSVAPGDPRGRRLELGRRARPLEPVVVEVRREHAPPRVRVRLERRERRCRLRVAVLAPLARENDDVVRGEVGRRVPQRALARRRAAALRIPAGPLVDVDPLVAGPRGVLRLVNADSLEEALERVRAAGGDRHLREVPFGAVAREAGRQSDRARLLVQAVTVGIVSWRRHLPIWTTSGMFVPAGTF